MGAFGLLGLLQLAHGAQLDPAAVAETCQRVRMAEPLGLCLRSRELAIDETDALGQSAKQIGMCGTGEPDQRLQRARGGPAGAGHAHDGRQIDRHRQQCGGRDPAEAAFRRTLGHQGDRGSKEAEQEAAEREPVQRHDHPERHGCGERRHGRNPACWRNTQEC